MATTDYAPGEQPVPVGTVVDYTGSRKHGRYVVVEHRAPLGNPNPDVADALHRLDEMYPDGVAYNLWPEGHPRRSGYSPQGIYYARRTSFAIAPAIPAD